MSDILKKLEQDEVIVGKLARAVVAKRLVIVAAVAAILQLLIGFNLITPGVDAYITHLINDGVDVIAVLVGIFYAQKGVTPVVDPRTNTGSRLVPLSRVKALVANAEAKADGANVTPAEEPLDESEQEEHSYAEGGDVEALDPDATAVAEDDVPSIESTQPTNPAA